MKLFDSSLCARCRGKGLCKNPCRIYSKIKDFSPKTRVHFSGNSPPEIFVGRYNYPKINVGILTPESSEESTEEFSMPEIWHKQKFSIEKILSNRGKLIYGRFKSQVRIGQKNKLLSTMQEVSMAYKPVSTEFFLKNPPKKVLELNIHSPIIGNPAELNFARLVENPKIKPKVDYLVSDIDAKSTASIIELYNSNIEISNINKILSAGLLGLKTQRKLVPTRWSITAVDDTISKKLIDKIRYYKEINEIRLYNSEYNGNHYEILLLPDKFSFEVLEAEISGGLWNETGKTQVMQDYELFHGRKYYADKVTGAYYANRLALAEFLEKIKRQASAIFLREIGPEYYAPLGVGILREISREAFNKNPEKFSNINAALDQIQKRLRIPISTFIEKSIILKDFGKQKRLNNWF